MKNLTKFNIDKIIKLILGISFLFFPVQVFAHGVGQVYNLPIPLKYYLGSAGLAVAFSFFIFALFVNGRNESQAKIFNVKWLPLILKALGFLAVASVFLAMAAGLVGANNSSNNIAPIFFWVIFILGFGILSLFVGNIWDKLNPWKTLTDLFGIKSGKRRISIWLGVVLVLLLYWFELSSGTSFVPFAIGGFLLGYTLLNFLALYFFGNWYQEGELFSVFFGFIGSLAYFRIGDNNQSFEYLPLNKRLFQNANWPLVGLAAVLLAGTSFDSFKETVVWFKILDFLGFIYSTKLIFLANTLGIILAPLPFLGFYLLLIWTMSKLTGFGFSNLAKQFAFSLVPIAFGYTLAHNFSLVIVTFPQFLGLLSNPFGFGWDLFGTVHLITANLILGAKYIWFIEIGFVVLAHIAGTFFAHVIASKIFTDKRKILLSQLPALALMVGFTVTTLWLLAQPLVVSK